MRKAWPQHVSWRFIVPPSALLLRDHAHLTSSYFLGLCLLYPPALYFSDLQGLCTWRTHTPVRHFLSQVQCVFVQHHGLTLLLFSPQLQICVSESSLDVAPVWLLGFKIITTKQKSLTSFSTQTWSFCNFFRKA